MAALSVRPEVFEQAVREHALYLGFNPPDHPDLLPIAREALTARLPPGWQEATDSDRNVYYFNSTTSESSWEHPLDAMYRQRVAAALQQRRRRRHAGKLDVVVSPSRTTAVVEAVDGGAPATTRLTTSSSSRGTPSRDMAEAREELGRVRQELERVRGLGALSSPPPAGVVGTAQGKPPGATPPAAPPDGARGEVSRHAELLAAHNALVAERNLASSQLASVRLSLDRTVKELCAAEAQAADATASAARSASEADAVGMDLRVARHDMEQLRRRHDAEVQGSEALRRQLGATVAAADAKTARLREEVEAGEGQASALRAALARERDGREGDAVLAGEAAAAARRALASADARPAGATLGEVQASLEASVEEVGRLRAAARASAVVVSGAVGGDGEAALIHRLAAAQVERNTAVLERDEVHAQWEATLRDLSSAGVIVERLRGERAAVGGELAARTAALEALQGEHAALHSTLARVTHAQDADSSAIASLAAENDVLHSMLAVVRAELEAQTSALLLSSTSSAREGEGHARHVAQLQADVAAAQGEGAALAEELDAAQAALVRAASDAAEAARVGEARVSEERGRALQAMADAEEARHAQAQQSSSRERHHDGDAQMQMVARLRAALDTHASAEAKLRVELGEVGRERDANAAKLQATVAQLDGARQSARSEGVKEKVEAAEVHALTAEVHAGRVRIQELTSRGDDASAAHAAALARARELEGLLTSEREKCAALASTAAVAESDRCALSSRLGDVTQDAQRLRGTLEETVVALAGERVRAEACAQELERVKSAPPADCGHTAELARLDAALRGAADEAGGLREEVRAAAQSAAHLQAQVDEGGAREAQARTALQPSHARCAQLESDVASGSARAEGLRADLAAERLASVQRAAGLEATAERARRDAQALQAEVDTLTHTLEEALAERVGKSASLLALRQEVDATRAQLATELGAVKAAAAAEVAALRREHEAEVAVLVERGRSASRTAREVGERNSARHASELEAVRAAHAAELAALAAAHTESEGRASSRLSGVEAASGALASELRSVQAALAQVRTECALLTSRLASAEHGRDTALAAVDTAVAASLRAEDERSALGQRVQELQRDLSAARARAAASEAAAADTRSSADGAAEAAAAALASELTAVKAKHAAVVSRMSAEHAAAMEAAGGEAERLWDDVGRAQRELHRVAADRDAACAQARVDTQRLGVLESERASAAAAASTSSTLAEAARASAERVSSDLRAAHAELESVRAAAHTEAAALRAEVVALRARAASASEELALSADALQRSEEAVAGAGEARARVATLEAQLRRVKEGEQHSAALTADLHAQLAEQSATLASARSRRSHDDARLLLLDAEVEEGRTALTRAREEGARVQAARVLAEEAAVSTQRELHAAVEGCSRVDARLSSVSAELEEAHASLRDARAAATHQHGELARTKLALSEADARCALLTLDVGVEASAKAGALHRVHALSTEVEEVRGEVARLTAELQLAHSGSLGAAAQLEAAVARLGEVEKACAEAKANAAALREASAAGSAAAESFVRQHGGGTVVQSDTARLAGEVVAVSPASPVHSAQSPVLLARKAASNPPSLSPPPLFASPHDRGSGRQRRHDADGGVGVGGGGGRGRLLLHPRAHQQLRGGRDHPPSGGWGLHRPLSPLPSRQWRGAAALTHPRRVAQLVHHHHRGVHNDVVPPRPGLHPWDTCGGRRPPHPRPEG